MFVSNERGAVLVLRFVETGFVLHCSLLGGWRGILRPSGKVGG